MSLLPRRSAPFVFAFLLSGFMTFIVSGIATMVAIGLAPELVALWSRSWITAWVIAFPALLLVRPLKGSETTRLRDPQNDGRVRESSLTPSS